MRNISIERACLEARDLIIRDGFTTGGAGWYGDGGWCIEGALGKAYGIDKTNMTDGQLSKMVNQSPAGVAIADYLVATGQTYPDRNLHLWNDRHADKNRVLDVLLTVAHEAAAAPRPEPLWMRLLRAYPASYGYLPQPVSTSAPEAPQEPSDEPSKGTSKVLELV